MDESQLKIFSSEGDSFVIPIDVAKLSVVFSNMIDVDVHDDAVEAQDVSLSNVNTAVLAKVIEFMHHYILEPMSEIEKVLKLMLISLLYELIVANQPLRSSNIGDVVQVWYANFVGNGMDQEMLFDLTIAANFLGVNPLLNLTCATIATMIKGKTPEEIRRTFNIVNDFTAEEEAAVREENKWCEEA